MLRKGEWVWVDSSIGVPIGARVKVTPSGQRLLVDDEGKVNSAFALSQGKSQTSQNSNSWCYVAECIPVFTLPQERRLSPEQEASLKIMHPTSVEGVDDMIKLGDMTEAGLLRNLLLRHRQGIIYTYTGSVLVAVNPYKNFPMYTEEQVRLYHKRKLGELPPHIFSIAEACYFNMTRHQKNQCCIISGESGAGKTESTKLILQYLAAVSGELSEQRIEKQILESNPILEAFGNAKTIRNDNSSRFGKYLEIFFNKDGVIEGARVEQYLLEKSRVCHQALEERNYHIFYCLLTGISAEEKKRLSLGNAKEYKFLTKGNCIACGGRDDAKDYSRINSALKTLNFSRKDCHEIFKLLAAILHLGNVCFEANTQNNLETSEVSKSEHFNVAASLLEVEKPTLATNLTHRSFKTNREMVTKPLSCEQAADCRDAFVKAIYNKLFIWIVKKINSVIYKKLTSNSKSAYLSVGLLDIFGFENFNTNSFEQLCINFANEKLQQFFVAHIFKLEQKEYMKQGVVWDNINFSDNQKILDLLAGIQCNVLALVDEESHFPKGTDATMLEKLNQHHKGHKNYIASRSERDTNFGICHFAGLVQYDSNGFLEKNRDAVSSDIIKMLDMSANKLLRDIFESELSTNGIKAVKNKKFIMTPSNSLRGLADTRKQVPTLSGQFRQSLDSLMKALSACQPFFIRCFKPNNGKQSEVFDRELCMRQLRYSGMIDTIRIRKLGFPIRHTFDDFLKRYRVLLKTTVCNPNTESALACCKAICEAVIEREGEWKIGNTKVFLKDVHDSILEKHREQELSRVALVIQRVMLGQRDRKSFLRKRSAAVVLQRSWRAYMKTKVQRGFERLAALIRSRKLQAKYQKQREAAVVIQAQVRGYVARKDLKKKREAVTRLQAQRRGVLARREVESMMDTALVLKQLEEVSQILDNETKSESEHDSDDEDLPVTPSVNVAEEETSESETSHSSPEPVKIISELLEPELIVSPPLNSISPTPSVDEDKEEETDDFEDDGDEFSFYRFSQRYFQDSASHTHIPYRLKKSLLHHDDEGDTLACLTIWWIILRFMGDIPEPKSSDAISVASSNTPQAPPSRQGRRLSNLVGLDQKILRKNKKKFDRRASSIPEEPENLTGEEDVMIGEGTTLQRPLSDLEKIHVIIGYALSKHGIWDEIYCQICKQLLKNNDRRNRMQGWILLSICLGIFPPTDLFRKYLENFLRRGPYDYRGYCIERLKRIVANGPRKELPCWIELQAAKTRKPIDTTVAIQDGRNIEIQLNSSSTSEEVCQDVANDIGLKDTYGFSLYIRLYDKMWSLGNSGAHVLDAISQCEEEMRRQGRLEKDTPWSLSLRKELFTPWHESTLDEVSTDLIYRQIIKGIKAGEYVADKDDDYIQLAIMHYYIMFGSEYSVENFTKVVNECITTQLIESKSKTRWTQFISSAHKEGPYVSGRQNSDEVKGELVDIARKKWAIHFSKFFEVTMMSGPPLPKSRFIVAINWTGIFFMDERNRQLHEIPYIAVRKVQEKSDSAQTISLITITGEYVLKSPEAEKIVTLIENNVEGLRQRSVFATAQQDSSKSDDPLFLVCKRGDLLQVDKEKSAPNESCFIATNKRTGSSGAVYKKILLFLPTLTEPTSEMLEQLNPKQDKRRASLVLNPVQGEETVAPVSLKEFALENFRSVSGGRQGYKGGNREKLWVISREPLKQPLLKVLVNNSELSNLACSAFTAILKYMGDYPIKHVRSPVELTDQIFGPATKHEELRDEIYCQIMRQMTANSNSLSMERGWQLMWLCSGLFPPSWDLLKHTQCFLESRPRYPLAALCLERLQEICSKKPRNLPPHFVEVDAIQQNSPKIFQKVHFPDDTTDIVEVTSTTTIGDMCISIASQLILYSPEGYGLYLKTLTKTVSMEEDKYFFDSLKITSDVPKKRKKGKEVTQTNLPSLVLFKRKLWFNVNPGKDVKADLTFHFPQERPRYLRGYHDCTKEDMITLGGLLFRVKVESDMSQFVMIPKMLKDLVPADQQKIMSPDEWKKHIISSYKQQSGITVDEAKIDFLKIISSWPTFGCTFFEVKQTCESSYPAILLIGINKQGVRLVDPETKDTLIMYEFSRITEYFSKGNSFQMTIGTMFRGITFVCETPNAHTIEDLLRSYVSMYEKARQAPLNHRKSIFS
ncbi:unconventional myosin-VIIb-like isoform X1 [Simochromis diagramma]|uniref:unconventional myosin-VIIb-like isoform X1 n=1 Tax=Simochromis diagramma TaxID=43689 RepID=UPI001A7ECBBA|nr:unconventional myosin-VIIb-like isoform X1 [Simochromis diagramma]